MSSEENALESRLKSYIESVRDKKLELEVAELSDKHLINDLAMDSLDIMNLLFEIQEKEKVEVSEADMESGSLYRFNKLADHIRQRQNG